MDRIDYTKKTKNFNTKRSINAQERIAKVRRHIDNLNFKGYDIYELGYRGKFHRLCLFKNGQCLAIGLTHIEETLWYIRYLENANRSGNI